MTNMMIPAPLQTALAEKGYDSLTAVQTAVLGDDAQGRDLLVSAQTGSGKTVAFGLAIGAQLIDDGALTGELPVALAIAPTRELALQVARELEWLYAATGAQIATCVGGMDYRNERRALARGAQIVVGTPGRLRDHIERGSLDLTALRAAVLDEADEMLDLGFREDLEFILGSAPDSRRTLMFSATVSPDIETLARDFQRDSLRIAARGEARQHGDISYQAFSVTARDREPAIFNLLRLHEARTAIVFCKTRANVNHLLARMSNRGFKVVALSGELSQQERNHALQALRDGRARVCIATDVAARGIDLPGLELVIHADLPTNPETLLHRSGRTGRAGAKGVSALIVPAADYKRAQRLLQRAKVVAEWGRAPGADEVRARDDQRMLDHPALRDAAPDDAVLAAQLLAQFGPEQMATAFIQLWREGRPAAEELHEVTAPPAPSAPRAPREFGDSVWYMLSVGHTGRAEARWLLPKICDAGGIDRNAIGAIRVKQDVSFVQIAADMADRFGDEAAITDEVSMRRMAEPPVFDAPEPRAPRGPRPDRGPRPERAPREPREPRAEREPRGDYAKPAPKPRRDKPESGDHRARVKAAKGGWIPDDAPLDMPADKPRAKRKPGAVGKSGWAAPKGKPRIGKGAAAKPHRKGPRRPA
ncbi:DEAD/DEAH box helicase [Paracoccus sp. (in: a-proteobacteria)]|uniref:DEAD/DEAH box helicase n=1 Tax=Paracoccus sp. TaxID=267 RepID=UPI0026E0925B|nr:DEAD/DEAH box helicase [Paracoccus sp. (in: a-proteobacteria)]MDO5647408.1 DEAD/DEAH box helicase [Paracoccus sp. (in: a-proteobacteria)]